MDGSAAGETLILTGVHGGEDFLFLFVDRAQILQSLDDLHPAKTTECDAVTGLTETEAALVNYIHQVRFVSCDHFST